MDLLHEGGVTLWPVGLSRGLKYGARLTMVLPLKLPFDLVKYNCYEKCLITAFGL